MQDISRPDQNEKTHNPHPAHIKALGREFSLFAPQECEEVLVLGYVGIML